MINGFFSIFFLILQEVELLRQEKQEIDQQLRAIQGNTSMNSMQNFTVQRRSDRGYSSDVDTMRPNRGSGASTSHQANNTSSTSGAGMRGRGGRGRTNNSRYHPGNNLHKNIEPTNYYNNNNDTNSSSDNCELSRSKSNCNSQNRNRGQRIASYNHGKNPISSRSMAKP